MLYELQGFDQSRSQARQHPGIRLDPPERSARLHRSPTTSTVCISSCECLSCSRRMGFVGIDGAGQGADEPDAALSPARLPSVGCAGKETELTSDRPFPPLLALQLVARCLCATLSPSLLYPLVGPPSISSSRRSPVCSVGVRHALVAPDARTRQQHVLCPSSSASQRTSLNRIVKESGTSGVVEGANADVTRFGSAQTGERSSSTGPSPPSPPSPRRTVDRHSSPLPFVSPPAARRALLLSGFGRTVSSLVRV